MSNKFLSRLMSLLFSICILPFFTACGTLDVGIEYTPTPDQAGTATVSALTTENARLATQVAMQATPTPMSNTTAPAQGLVPGTETVIDCTEVYPGLPGCLREESLVGGRLAFVDSRPPFDGHAVVIDLEQGDVKIVGESPAALIGWSPSGEYLLTGGEGYTVYHYDGTEITRYDDLPAPPFWAPSHAFAGAQDWLALPTEEGALLAVPFATGETHQVLPPGSLGSDGRGNVRWSPDLRLAWSLNTDQMASAGQWQQMLHVRPVEESAKVTTWRLSEDIRQTYYQIMDWVPGSHFILAGRGMMSVSMWVDGVPLVTINANTGEIIDLGITMLGTPEAYAWSPTKPGLLALAEGSGRFLFSNKRLAMLDALAGGELTYLTDEETAAFEPAWSPDGMLLAYAAGPASPDAAGAGDALEKALAGRAIYLFDPASGQSRALTEPGEAAIDGWPQWSADGTRLLYTRQHDGCTDVRVVTLDGSSDELLVAGLADPMCFYGGCNWRPMLAYDPGP